MPDNHIKVGGAWKAIDDCSVKVSAAWKQVDNIYVKVSGAWKQVWQNLTVSMTAINLQNSRGIGSCIAYVKFGTDGNIYESDETGSYGAATDQWLDSGDSSSVWIELTESGPDSLTKDDTAGGRVQLNTDREVGNLSSSGIVSTTVEFRFYDAASGGNLLHTRSGNIIVAERT